MRALLLLLLFLIAPSAYAAEFTALPQTPLASTESETVVDVFLNTEGELINAFGGTLLFPKETLSIQSIRTGQSIVSVWVESPHESNPGEIRFSGIVPGGYRGREALLFQVVFATYQPTNAALIFKDLEAFRSDAYTTALSTRSTVQVLAVSPIGTDARIPEDTNAPESFIISVASSPDAYDGKKVAVFATQDKGSGVAYYNVCEGFFGSCTRTTATAYVLKDQFASQVIRVYAIDMHNNERVAWLFTPLSVLRYVLYILVAILIVIGARFIYRRAL